MTVQKRFVITSDKEGSAFNDVMRQQVKEDPDVLYLKCDKYQKQSTAGDMLDCDAAVADLEAFLAAATLD